MMKSAGYFKPEATPEWLDLDHEDQLERSWKAWTDYEIMSR